MKSVPKIMVYPAILVTIAQQTPDANLAQISIIIIATLALQIIIYQAPLAYHVPILV